MDELGYDVEWQVLNSADFGVPQNRPRVFIVGHLRGTHHERIFPIKKRDGTSDEITIPKRSGNDIVPVFNISMPESTRRNIASRIYLRNLTPKEYFRLQGFPDDYFDRAAAVNSDSQLYKQAGNSVTVNVIYEIARRLT